MNLKIKILLKVETLPLLKEVSLKDNRRCSQTPMSDGQIHMTVIPLFNRIP